MGFYCGNIKFLSEDMRVLKPTIMPSVPRLLNRIYEKEMENVVPSLFKRVLYNMALRSKENEIKKLGLSPILAATSPRSSVQNRFHPLRSLQGRRPEEQRLGQVGLRPFAEEHGRTVEADDNGFGPVGRERSDFHEMRARMYSELCVPGPSYLYVERV